MRRAIIVLVSGLMLTGTFGCAPLNKSEQGAIIGAAGGAVVGGVIGNKAGNTAAGAILGAAVGGVAGAIIGSYMDDQAEEMERELAGARIERIGEGIKITFESGLLFDVDKSDLQAAAQKELTDLSAILKKYEETEILIEGHTDSDGSESYNQSLSERRAQSVRNYLAGHGVKGARMTMVGYGESQPVASNETRAGKQANRRVEVAIWANDELKRRAEREAERRG